MGVESSRTDASRASLIAVGLRQLSDLPWHRGACQEHY